MADELRAADDAWKPRRLSFEEAREEQRRYWASKTPVERLMAAAELKRLLAMRGIDVDAQPWDLTPRIIRRTKDGGEIEIPLHEWREEKRRKQEAAAANQKYAETVKGLPGSRDDS